MIVFVWESIKDKIMRAYSRSHSFKLEYYKFFFSFLGLPCYKCQSVNFMCTPKGSYVVVSWSDRLTFFFCVSSYVVM